jgi:hypothetical protein
MSRQNAQWLICEARPGHRRRYRDLSRMRHPLTEVPNRDGIIVGFAAPAEHEFGRAVEALCAVLRASGL